MKAPLPEFQELYERVALAAIFAAAFSYPPHRAVQPAVIPHGFARDDAEFATGLVQRFPDGPRGERWLRIGTDREDMTPSWRHNNPSFHVDPGSRGPAAPQWLGLGDGEALRDLHGGAVPSIVSWFDAGSWHVSGARLDAIAAQDADGPTHFDEFDSQCPWRDRVVERRPCPGGCGQRATRRASASGCFARHVAASAHRNISAALDACGRFLSLPQHRVTPQQGPRTIAPAAKLRAQELAAFASLVRKLGQRGSAEAAAKVAAESRMVTLTSSGIVVRPGDDGAWAFLLGLAPDRLMAIGHAPGRPPRYRPAAIEFYTSTRFPAPDWLPRGLIEQVTSGNATGMTRTRGGRWETAKGPIDIMAAADFVAVPRVLEAPTPRSTARWGTRREAKQIAADVETFLRGESVLALGAPGAMPVPPAGDLLAWLAMEKMRLARGDVDGRKSPLIRAVLRDVEVRHGTTLDPAVVRTSVEQVVAGNRPDDDVTRRIEHLAQVASLPAVAG